MQAYAWPGNVRELEHAIERAVILCDGEHIGVELLALNAPRKTPATVENTGGVDPDGDAGGTDLSLEAYFKAFVEKHQGEMTETRLAARLGISRKALWERRQRLGIPKPR
jgi:DNA-binding NtrC family response regulator